MRSFRIALTALAVAFATIVPASAATNRSDPGFVWDGVPGPAPEGGGDVCPPVDVVSALPFSDPGTTCDNTNTITSYGGQCGIDLPFTYAGEDAAYQVTLGAGNNIAFSMSLAGSAGDLALYMVGTCGSGTPCLAHSQDAIGAGTGPEIIAAASYTPGTYFVYVDSYYDAGTTASCGTYTLSITGTLPVELQSFSVD